jgi:hypothetical protein
MAGLMPAGYSGTPLAQKLGLKERTRAVVLGAPRPYAKIVAPLPAGVTVVGRLPQAAGFVHCFVTRRSELERRMPALTEALEDSGMIWISWPKKASGVSTDLTEEVIRATALQNRLVDVKVCAVDEVWSGLKLVRRVAERGRG